MRKNSSKAINLENQYGAHNYHPLPVVLSKGKGVHVWDIYNLPEGTPTIGETVKVSNKKSK